MKRLLKRILSVVILAVVLTAGEGVSVLWYQWQTIKSQLPSDIELPFQFEVTETSSFPSSFDIMEPPPRWWIADSPEDVETVANHIRQLLSAKHGDVTETMNPATGTLEIIYSESVRYLGFAIEPQEAGCTIKITETINL